MVLEDDLDAEKLSPRELLDAADATRAAGVMEERVLIKGIGGIALEKGSFVVINPKSVETTRSSAFSFAVGMIVGVKEKELEINLFLPAREYCEKEGLGGGMLPTESDNGKFTRELIRTSLFASVNQGDILDVALVFDESFIDSTPLSAIGLDNVFLCRSMHLEMEDKVQPYDIKPFCSDFIAKAARKSLPQCFGKLLHSSLCSVQKKMGQMNRTTAQRNGYYSFQRRTVGCSALFWKYLITKLEMAQPEFKFHLSHPTAIFAIVGSGMVCHTRRLSNGDACKVEFETANDLALFRSIFGITSTFGHRKPRPSLDSTSVLCENDKMNVILPTDVDDSYYLSSVSVPFIDGRSDREVGPSASTPKECPIRFIFDGLELKIRIAITQLMYKPEKTYPCKALDSFINHNLEASNSEADPQDTVEESYIFKGGCFSIGAQVYEITEVTRTSVKACHVDNTYWIETFNDKAQVLEYLKKSNGISD